MNCSARLKHETSRAHLHTEKLLLRKLHAINSVDDYQHILRIFYGFFQPVELAISDHLNSSILPDYDSRGIAGRIKNDLATLNDLRPITVSADLPQIGSVPAACGAMYVIEGSTLGGQVIARMIRENPDIQITDESLTFFRGYNENTIPMWRTFQDFLNDTFRTETEIARVTSTATETFKKMGDWITLYTT